MQLPKNQQSLINELASVNKKIIVVLVSGGITALERAFTNIQSLIQAFYPGQDGGNAIADLLFGKINPAGRLPVIMPINDSQLPDWNDIDFTNDVVDGFGYRRFDTKGIKPQYAFGHGLSYTTFKYENMEIIPPSNSEAATIVVKIKNTGPRDGEEVAQLYTSVKYTDPVARKNILMPLKQLKGFKRAFIKSGETKTIKFQLSPDELAFWSENDDSFRVEAGVYTIKVGGSSDNLPLSRSFDVTSSVLYDSKTKIVKPAMPIKV